MDTAKRSPKRTAKIKRSKSTDVPPEVEAEFQNQLDAYIGEWKSELTKHIDEQDRATAAKRAKSKRKK